jgi:hypothetical protein
VAEKEQEEAVEEAVAEVVVFSARALNAAVSLPFVMRLVHSECT